MKKQYIEIRCPNFRGCEPNPPTYRFIVKFNRVSFNSVTETYQCPNCGLKLTIPIQQRVLLQNITKYKKRIHKAQSKMSTEIQLHGELGHIIVPTDTKILEKLKTDKWASCGTVCIICGEHFGWFCPEAPDKSKPYCTYETKRYGCDHCGMPRERK